MIEISGSAQRSYEFPAHADEAFAFHRDVDRSIALLPHISIVSHLGPGRYRLLYSATETGLYKVRIFCDVEARTEGRRRRILILPLTPSAAVSFDAGLYSMSGYGRFASEIAFRPSGSATVVTYGLSLGATLPVPVSLRLLPDAVITAAANRTLHRRMEEIIGRFIDASIKAFQRRSSTAGPA